MNSDLSKTACKVMEAVALLADSYPDLCLLVASDGEYIERVQQVADSANGRVKRNMIQVLGFDRCLTPEHRHASLPSILAR